jgi:hypothetical protein
MGRVTQDIDITLPSDQSTISQPPELSEPGFEVLRSQEGHAAAPTIKKLESKSMCCPGSRPGLHHGRPTIIPH